MPRTQVASIGTYDFGAPTAEGVVLQFRKKDGVGGRLQLTFENPEDSVANLEVTVQVGEDGTTWADTSAANNLTAIANQTIVRKAHRTYEMLLRTIDNYFRVQAVGATRGILQMRGDQKLEITQI